VYRQPGHAGEPQRWLHSVVWSSRRRIAFAGKHRQRRKRFSTPIYPHHGIIIPWWAGPVNPAPVSPPFLWFVPIISYSRRFVNIKSV